MAEGVRFEDAAREFLAQWPLYSDDRRSMPSQMRILGRWFTGLTLEQIGTPQIQAFMAARLAEGVKRPTLNRHRAALSALYTWALSVGIYRGPNPARIVRKYPEALPPVKYLTGEEADRLVLAAAPHLKPILIVALHTGGRMGELLRLLWRDVDLTARTVTFARESTKSKKTRTLPMDDDCLRALLSLRRGQPDQTVFSFNDSPIKGLRTAWRTALRRAGLPHVSIGITRHSFASWYMMNRGDAGRLQFYLGHSDSRQTRRYVHFTADFLRDGIEHFGPPRLKRSDEGQQKSS